METSYTPRLEEEEERTVSGEGADLSLIRSLRKFYAISGTRLLFRPRVKNSCYSFLPLNFADKRSLPSRDSSMLIEEFFFHFFFILVDFFFSSELVG